MEDMMTWKVPASRDLSDRQYRLISEMAERRRPLTLSQIQEISGVPTKRGVYTLISKTRARLEELGLGTITNLRPGRYYLTIQGKDYVETTYR